MDNSSSALTTQHLALLRALTHSERRLLVCLQRANGRPVSYLELAAVQWYEGATPDYIDANQEATLRQHIRHIRTKLRDAGVPVQIVHATTGYIYQGAPILPLPTPPVDPNTLYLPLPRAWANGALRLELQVYKQAAAGYEYFSDRIMYKIVDGQPVLTTPL